jgi:hypothetical protein
LLRKLKGLKVNNLEIKPLTKQNQEMIDQHITTFVTWYNKELQPEHYEYFHNDSTYRDLNTLDWILYEQIYWGYKLDDFIIASAYILGRVLTHYTNLTWGEMEIGEKNSIVLYQEDSKMIIPIVEFCIYKKSIIYLPDDGIETIFFDIIFSSYRFQSEKSHPFLRMYDLDIETTPNFYDTFAYTIPDDIKQLLEPYMKFNDELCIRVMGVEAYEWCINGEWNKIKEALKEVEHYFSNDSELGRWEDFIAKLA